MDACMSRTTSLKCSMPRRTWMASPGRRALLGPILVLAAAFAAGSLAEPSPPKPRRLRLERARASLRSRPASLAGVLLHTAVDL